MRVRCARQGQERQSLAGSQQFSAGKEQMQSFCYTSSCRHAALIAHFEPNGAPPAGQPCQCAPLVVHSMAISCLVLRFDLLKLHACAELAVVAPFCLSKPPVNVTVQVCPLHNQ